MKISLILSATMAVCALCPAVYGQYFNFCGDSDGCDGDWATKECWELDHDCDGNGTAPNAPTGSLSHAEIEVGETCNITTSVGINTLTLEGTLNVQSGATLTLGADYFSGSEINGVLNLYGDLEFNDESYSLFGSGKIVGMSSTAGIGVNSNFGHTIELQNFLTIEGALTISNSTSGTGIFRNFGVVDANGEGTTEDPAILRINCNVEDQSPFAGIWRVSTSSSVLQFEPTNTDPALLSNFEVLNGTLDILQDFTTEGRLTHSLGTIDVDSSVTEVVFSAPSS